MPIKRFIRVVAIFLISCGILLAVFAGGFMVGRRSVPTTDGRTWVYLSDLQWTRANTGWIGAAGDFLPRLNTSFNLRPISLNGRVFSKGIGTYPLSEIEYALDKKYSVFRSQVGINDGVPTGAGSADFLVFVDGNLAYESGKMTGGDPPQSINIAVADADRLRLVVSDATDGNEWDYASWGGARLLTKGGWTFESFASNVRKAVETRLSNLSSRKEKAKDDLKALATKHLSEIQQAFGNIDLTGNKTARVAFDARDSQVILANNKIAILYGLGGVNHANLSVFHLPSKSLIIENGVGSVSKDGQRWFNLHDNTREREPGHFKVEDTEDTGLGKGKRLTIELTDQQDSQPIDVILTLYDDKSYFTYQIGTSTSSSSPGTWFRYFDMKAESKLVTGENEQYIADYSQVRQGEILDDSVTRKETIGLGKPIFLWNAERNEGLMQAIIDVTEYPSYFSAEMDPGKVMADFSLEHYDPQIAGSDSEMTMSKRLFVEVTDTNDTRYAFQDYKDVMAALYPPAPMPTWVKYQWLSWYVNYMDISEEAIKRQIDYISDNLLDLGDWNILIDAGWYVAEGRDGAGWRSVDYSKFPNGLRSVVDYAHSKGLKVVLYFSSPYVDNRQLSGNWLGLKGIVDNHKDWLIPLSEDENGASYVYDYSNPGWRNYLAQVMEDFFVRYDVDGLKLDGMGDAEGAIINLMLRGAFGQDQRSLTQSVQTYEFLSNTVNKLKSDVYIESGWVTPIFAHPYAQTFRYGDEFPLFDNRYPFTGLEQHIDYAIIQKTILGQRPNMGAIYGDPNEDVIGLSWLEAALAMGTQVSISLDLPSMSKETLSDYRERLVHYNAFQGETTFGGTLYADTFRTTSGNTTYLGVINRQDVVRTINVDFSQLGMELDSSYIAYDVTERRFFRPWQSFAVNAEPQSFRLYVIRNTPGIMWTNSSYVVLSEEANSISLALKGPNTLKGFARLYVPIPRHVYMDETELELDDLSQGSTGTYAYDFDNQILTVNYEHVGEHTLNIEW